MGNNASQTIMLATSGTDAGAMERLFLLEAISPGNVHRYKPTENLNAMRLMRQTIDNRLKAPYNYSATGAKTATDIIELGNQFAGFSTYPNLNSTMTDNLNRILQAANTSDAYTQFVQDAITASTEITPPTTRYPDVTAWRTNGSGSPGRHFHKLVTLSGNTFYATNPVPPHPPHHVRHRQPARHAL